MIDAIIIARLDPTERRRLTIAQITKARKRTGRAYAM
jgi:hypothetical protein